MAEGIVAGYGIFVLLAVAIAVLWVVMPFIIIGIKNRMSESISVQSDILREIKNLRRDIDNIREDAKEQGN